MAEKRVQKNPAIFYDRIFTHSSTILIFISSADGLSQGADLYYPQKVDVCNIIRFFAMKNKISLK